MAILFYVSQNLFVGSLHFKPFALGLELIIYILHDTWQQVLPCQHFFLFLALVNICIASIPLHRLELISFLTIPGNKQ